MRDPRPQAPPSGARTALAVGAAALAFALVSLATRAGSSAPGAPPGWGVAGTVAHHGVMGLGIALAPVMLALGAAVWIVGGTLARRKRAEEEAEDPDARRRRLIRNLVFACSVCAAVIVVRTGVVDMHRLHLHVPGAGGGTAGHGRPHAGASGQPGQVDWGIAIALWVALAALAAVTVVRWRRGRPDEPAATVAEAPSAAARPDFGALRELADPREAVVGAYAAMERLLDGRALGRNPAEGPREYLARIGRRLRRTRGDARRLTGLYERARFSAHPIDRAMQREAVDALEAVDGDREEPA
jgi:Domain of unknown function (DUF4129)